MKKAILEPLISVSGIKFSDNIENYPNRVYEYSDNAGKTQYDAYSFVDVPVVAYVENNEIDSVRCAQECIWQGIDLIGLDYEKFKQLYSNEPTTSDYSVPVMIGEGEQNQDAHDYDELGIHVWVYDGKIVTIVATVYEDE